MSAPRNRYRFWASRNWREEVAFFSGMALLAGLWFVVSPWILGFADGQGFGTNDDSPWNNWVFGGLVSLIAGARLLGAYRVSWLSFLNAGLGVWIFLSGFWLYETVSAQWNSFIFGIVILLASLASGLSTAESKRQAGTS